MDSVERITEAAKWREKATYRFWVGYFVGLLTGGVLGWFIHGRW